MLQMIASESCSLALVREDKLKTIDYDNAKDKRSKNNIIFLNK